MSAEDALAGGPLTAPDDGARWAGLLGDLVAGRDLDTATTQWALSRVMSGRADDARLAGLLVGLRAKGETVEEVAGLADAMLAHAVALPVAGPVLDIVGTGGSDHRRAGSMNISTAAAVVAAAAGAVVVKHGNRAASSKCGSADVLQALGVDIDISPERVAAVAAEIGLTFAFAQRFHPATRHAAAVRRSLGIRTAFNVLGPLTNPARPAAMAVGVSDARWTGVVAGVLARNGVSALVFRSDDGVDELTAVGGADVWVVVGGEVAQGRFEPAALGLAVATLEDLAGGDAAENAARLREVLDGEPGPASDTVVLNAAAGLLAADLAAERGAGATGRTAADVAADLTGSLPGPMERARGAIARGEATSLLQRWVAATGTR